MELTAQIILNFLILCVFNTFGFLELCHSYSIIILLYEYVH
jgi:hypothetical protein